MDSSKTMLFVIPLRNPSTADNWKRCVELCRRSVESAAGQRNVPADKVQVILVCKSYPHSISHPENVTVLRHDFPDPGSRRGMRKDKYRKIKMGLVHACQYTPTYVMKMDADDLVSARIAEYVLSDDNEHGYYVEKGYVWKRGSFFLKRKGDFHRGCGTSNVLYAEKESLPQSMEDTKDYDLISLGHNIAVDTFAERKSPLSPLPFRGAVKVMHGQNISSTHPLDHYHSGASPNWKYYAGKIIFGVKDLIHYRPSGPVLSAFGKTRW